MIAPRIIFGNWEDMVIGLWGGVDVIINPYSQSTTGTVGMTLIVPCDVEFRHKQSFAKINDINAGAVASYS